MKLIFKQKTVISEHDIANNKVQANIELVFDIEHKEETIHTFSRIIESVSDNKETGEQMDAKREKDVNKFLDEYLK
jgi:hypothetical protein